MNHIVTRLSSLLETSASAPSQRALHMLVLAAALAVVALVALVMHRAGVDVGESAHHLLATVARGMVVPVGMP